MDLLTVRKLGAPQNPEFAVGAVAEDGSAVLDRDVCERLRLTQEQIDAVVQREVRELDRRVELYRDDWEPVDVRGRTVIIVDDGLATGLSDLAAVRAVRRRGAARVIVAAPGRARRQAVALLAEEADEVLCADTPRDFGGVGLWYEDFSPVSDEEVLALMAGAGMRVPAPRPGASRARCSISGPSALRGDLAVPDGATRPCDLRPRKRQQPPERPQPRGRLHARAARLRDAAVRPAHRGGGRQTGSSSSTFPCSPSALCTPPPGPPGGRTSVLLPGRLLRCIDGRRRRAARPPRRSAESVHAVVSRGGRPDLAGRAARSG